MSFWEGIPDLSEVLLQKFVIEFIWSKVAILVFNKDGSLVTINLILKHLEVLTLIMLIHYIEIRFLGSNVLVFLVLKVEGFVLV